MTRSLLSSTTERASTLTAELTAYRSIESGAHRGLNASTRTRVARPQPQSARLVPSRSVGNLRSVSGDPRR